MPGGTEAEGMYAPDRLAISPRSQIRRNFIDKASALLAL
jgi:hypothetical protein